jgi:hypothetical protein
VPEKKFGLKIEGQNFILFLQDLRMCIIKQEKETSDPAKHYNVSSSPGGEAQLSDRKLIDHYILLQMKYAIYDNSKGVIVACGLLWDKEKYNISKNFPVYLQNSFKSFASKVIDDSPFAKY